MWAYVCVCCFLCCGINRYHRLQNRNCFNRRSMEQQQQKIIRIQNTNATKRMKEEKTRTFAYWLFLYFIFTALFISFSFLYFVYSYFEHMYCIERFVYTVYFLLGLYVCVYFEHKTSTVWFTLTQFNAKIVCMWIFFANTELMFCSMWKTQFMFVYSLACVCVCVFVCVRVGQL